MLEIVYTCKCSHKGEYDLVFRITRLIDELVEFINEPSSDEWGDTVMQVSLLFHCVFPKWRWLLPGAERSQIKGLNRFAENGCCRSRRNSCK